MERYISIKMVGTDYISKESKEVMREPSEVRVLGDLLDDKIRVNERIRKKTQWSMMRRERDERSEKNG